MGANRVKQMWRDGKPVAVGWCTTADPYVTEVMVRAGFDSLILDMQHGMAIGPERAATWLQIVGQADVTPIVRVPWNEPAFAQWVLDAGALGIIFPLVNNLDDARKAIDACRYPPLGRRSNGPNRARFALGPDYFPHANEEVLCLLMMETMEAIGNLEEIAQLPGVDGYFIGPSDLSLSMGLPPAFDVKDPRHIAAVQRVIDVAGAHGQQAGIYVTGPDEAVRRWEQGFNLNPVCDNIGLFASAVSAALARFREGLQN